MSISIAVVLSLVGLQGVVQDLPSVTYTPAVTAGQREIVMGPALQYDVTMEVRYEKDTPAEFTPNKILGDSEMIYAQGYVRWSVTDGTLFDKPCRVIKMDGMTKGENKTKLKRIEYASRNQTTYWVGLDGKLLRQSVQLQDPWETKHAECVFWKDHIAVSLSDKTHRKSFEVYPNVDLSMLDNQFKPMMDRQKVILPSKEYLVFDPFTQAFDKYKAYVGGTFHGMFLAAKFEGIHIDIEGPKNTVKAYISKEGDLVKVDLPSNRSLVLDSLPHSRDPMYQRTAKGN